MNQLSKTIKEFRESKGWSKAQLGRALKGVSGQLIGQYEREKDPKTPGADFFIKWKTAFGKDLLYETKVSHETDEKDPLEIAIQNLTIGHRNDSESLKELVYILKVKYGIIAPQENLRDKKRKADTKSANSSTH